MIAESNPISSPRTALQTVLELATREVFELMVGTSLEERQEEITEDLDITAMIGLAGSLCGVISIRCSADAARLIAAKMLGIPVSEANLSMKDAVAETVNMIAGNFKSKLSGSDHCMLSIPTVITGADYQLCSIDVGQIVQLFVAFDKYPIKVAMELHS
jgi:CheY-specific phosphatase CheX